jgi:hypothetical protein
MNQQKDKPERDPCENPLVGDVVVSRKDRKFRKVVKRDGNNIHYIVGVGYGDRDKHRDYNKSHMCWILTWREWCRRNDIVEVHT